MFHVVVRQQKTRRASCIGGSQKATEAGLSGRSHTCTTTAADTDVARFRSERFRTVRMTTQETMTDFKE
jgi:hypothetical protein